MGLVFWGRRIPSPSIYRSLAISNIMIMLGITKALMSQQISNDKKKSKLKQIKQLVWIISLSHIIFQVNMTQWSLYIFMLISYGQDFNRISSSEDNSIFILVTLIICMYLFMYKNCFKQHLQTKVRFLTLSIYHLITCLANSFAIIANITQDLSIAISMLGAGCFLMNFHYQVRR